MKFFKFSILILFLLSLNISAADYFWYDGKKKRKITMSEDMVAQKSSAAAGKLSVKSLDSSSEEVKFNNEAFRVFKIKKNSFSKSLKSGVVPSEFEESSPVFLDRSNRKRVLAGNIIVFFDKSWSQTNVLNWAEENSLVVLKCISSYNNIYLIESPVGIESLELANSLVGKNGIVSAMPNWATEVSKK